MKKPFHILVFPGGTEIGLEIQKALAPCKEVRLFSAGSDVSNHAPFVFARHFVLPSIHEPGWIEALNRVVEAESIDYIFPAFDDVIVALAQHAGAIKAGIVSSPLETCTVTRSKSETYRVLDGVVPVPERFRCAADVSSYPVFVKPDRGEGSRDTHLVHCESQLLALLQADPERIALEYLPGEEYTVDCFSDRDAGLLFCGARQRVRTKSGISMSSEVAPAQETFADYAARIAERLAFHGAWFFQVKRDRHGVLKLLEVAPRIAGTMALHRVQGVNFPLLSIYEQERFPLSLLVNRGVVSVDRALVNRYRHQINFGTVYVDLDDTLILHGKVNVQLAAFLYQCLNQGKKIVLLTRHAGDLDATLARFRLAHLFDAVVHVGKDDTKARYITEPDAIFIDDSFSERKAVSDRLGISTFDCSMLELLMDERI
ncbi:ATP-grasp domain-containing protein [Geomonas paludis]|uniref:ATP-grasp domain-containing protein n=1 Tax=Geomonas paludis TaxID=2740185 RepID=A0A6V8MYW2_9BACT|nr:ATP-grasp domain-containing protein [Geomonas paludis]UPU34384.1 ATP-grasp domain-containing protein [Geomonas paludis]GFO64369.1 carbamoylphosphate synthase large subunit short form [Geomonas paludis]